MAKTFLILQQSALLWQHTHLKWRCPTSEGGSFEVKSSLTVKDFKINLEHFKKTNMENVGRESNFWKVSETVLSKIEGKSYLDNKTRHNEYLSTNPFAARKLFINMRGYNSTMGC